jgi:hypothetical protein
VNSLEKRIAALEARTGADPVILHFADGSQRTIRGSYKHWAALNEASTDRHAAQGAGHPTPTNSLQGELDAIRDAVRIEEYAGMFNLLQVMLQGPVSRDHEGKSDERTADDKGNETHQVP